MLFKHENCAKCDRFQTNPEVGTLVQFKFLDRNSKHCKYRLKISKNFEATLPETDKPDQKKNEHEPDTV